MKRFNFSGGEVHIQYDEPKNIYILYEERRFNLWSSDDIMAMLLADNARHYAAYQIPYVPYARQDRIMNEGEPLSIKVMTDLINSMNCEQITIWDPHSDVTPALINNCRVVHQYEILSKFKLPKYDGIISPDAGAEKKAFKVAQSFGIPLYRATKIRDVTNGEIASTSLIDPVKENCKYLVVDDICDGGRTFIELAKQIRNYVNVERLDLYVTHGIFSKGVQVLLGSYNNIYTANVKDTELKSSDNFTILINKETIL